MKSYKYILFFMLILSACKYRSSSLSDLTPKQTDSLTNEPAAQTVFPKDTQLTIYGGYLTLPKGWRLADKDTLPPIADATARYRFQNGNKKLIYLQYGLGTIGNPAEPNVISSRFRKGYVANNVDTTDILFSDNPQVGQLRAKGDYLFSIRKVSAFQATYFKPKKIGSGYIGLYIDSIGHIGTNIADLVYYSKGLDSTEAREFENTIPNLLIKDFR